MRGKYVIAGIGHTKFGRLPGRGTVSMNVEACYHEALRERLPYNVALIELDEGPRLITNIVNPGAGIAAEKPVKLKIEDEHGVALARFALT